jgi:hypothetical protein
MFFCTSWPSLAREDTSQMTDPMLTARSIQLPCGPGVEVIMSLLQQVLR